MEAKDSSVICGGIRTRVYCVEAKASSVLCGAQGIECNVWRLTTWVYCMEAKALSVMCGG